MLSHIKAYQKILLLLFCTFMIINHLRLSKITDEIRGIRISTIGGFLF